MSTRPFGEILLDLESILEEMVDSHDVQRYDIIALVDYWVRIHRPDSVETYEDGSQPVPFGNQPD